MLRNIVILGLIAAASVAMPMVYGDRSSPRKRSEGNAASPSRADPPDDRFLHRWPGRADRIGCFYGIECRYGVGLGARVNQGQRITAANLSTNRQ
jgi:hypothetical protein